jgi:glucan phosphoethanolaminetransferase (alkaline phosphatase superfamily)
MTTAQYFRTTMTMEWTSFLKLEFIGMIPLLLLASMIVSQVRRKWKNLGRLILQAFSLSFFFWVFLHAGGVINSYKNLSSTFTAIKVGSFSIYNV